MMIIEYNVIDRLTGQLIGRSCQPDMSTKSERRAIIAVGASPQNVWIEVETREIHDAGPFFSEQEMWE